MNPKSLTGVSKITPFSKSQTFTFSDNILQKICVRIPMKIEKILSHNHCRH